MTRKKERGQLIVLSGPSGAGKSTVVAELMNQRENLHFSVSYTTRAPRMGEQDGVNYHFISREAFQDMIHRGELLEWAEYVDHRYGTGAREVQEQLDLGRDVLLDIEVRGAAQVKEKRPDALLIFIIPPSFEELSRRLHRRNTDREEVIQGRLEKARAELAAAEEYDYLVVNDKVSGAVEEIQAILTAAECRVERRRYVLDRFP